MDSLLYFLMYYIRIPREDSDCTYFSLPEDEKKKSKCVLSYNKDFDEKNNLYNYNKIFKVPKSNTKGKKIIMILKFELVEIYIIKFDKNKNTYIYDVDLLYERIILDISNKKS